MQSICHYRSLLYSIDLVGEYLDKVHQHPDHSLHNHRLCIQLVQDLELAGAVSAVARPPIFPSEQVPLAQLHGLFHNRADSHDGQLRLLFRYCKELQTSGAGQRTPESERMSRGDRLHIYIYHNSTVPGYAHLHELLHGNQVEQDDRGLQQGVLHGLKP